jgi:hypothetical protein
VIGTAYLIAACLKRLFPADAHLQPVHPR